MAKASGVSVGEGGKGMGAATVNMLCCGCAAVLSRQARQDLRCAYAEHVHGVDVSLILDQFGELITCPVKEGDGARLEVTKRWYRSLCRRSHKKRLDWRKMNLHVRRWLPPPKIQHPWPEERFFAARTQGKSPVR